MDSITATSAYDSNRLGLVANGYHPLPIGPGSKKPMVIVNGEYRDMVAWQDPSRRVIETSQPGAGLGVRTGRQRDGTYLIAIDLDDDAVAIAAMDLLPFAVAKIGRRGNTIFLQSDKPIRSRNFLVNGAMKAQILSDGRQTVIPPSIHPDTKRPYAWETDRALFNTHLSALPVAPDNLVDLILLAIAGAGYTVDAEELKAFAEPRAQPGFDEASPHWQINELAMRKVSAWVPDLNLYKWRRKVGRYASYEAVATWRESSTGRPLEQRKLNLSISGARGIVDFGTGETFSPLDLVMRARNCARSAAYEWLAERVMANNGPEVDFDKIIENAEAPSIEPGKEQDDPPNAGEDALVSLVGQYWDHGDPLPKQIPMLVPYFVPARGAGYLGGQRGTYKTFILNDLAAAVASGGMFANQQVVEKGAVVQVELEGSKNEERITGSIDARGVKERLPIRIFSQMPPKIIANGAVNPQFKEWCKGIVIMGRRLAQQHGVPLRLITIDPVNSVAGFKDEQSSAEAQIVYDGLMYLAGVAECVVCAADHYGKNADSGLRGSSVKETAAMFILGTSPKVKDLGARRHLEIRKMRNGLMGVAMDFFMDEHPFTTTQRVEDGDVEALVTVERSTLTIRWDGDLHPVNGDDEAKPKPKTQSEQCMDELRKLMADAITRVASGEAPGGYAVRSALWQATMAEAGISANRFYQVKSKLLADGRIGENTEERTVWIALG